MSVPPQSKVCPSCGQSVPFASVWCPQCRYDFRTSTPASEQGKYADADLVSQYFVSLKGLLTVAIVLLIVLIAFAVVNEYRASRAMDQAEQAMSRLRP